LRDSAGFDFSVGRVVRVGVEEWVGGFAGLGVAGGADGSISVDRLWFRGIIGLLCGS
jgi:hypothetical protein